MHSLCLNSDPLPDPAAAGEKDPSVGGGQRAQGRRVHRAAHQEGRQGHRGEWGANVMLGRGGKEGCPLNMYFECTQNKRVCDQYDCHSSMYGKICGRTIYLVSYVLKQI